MTSSEDEPTISIPTIVLLCLLSFLALRYYLSARDSLAAAPGTGRVHGRRVNPEQVEQIAQMFPQLSRRDIMWDLQRNGGSVASTTERILGGGGLDVVSSFLLSGFDGSIVEFAGSS
jgi:coupling of ubiquitin conjugation to ER degradation protein 1